MRTIQFDFSCADLEEYQKRIISQLTAMEVGVLVNNVGVAFEYPDVLHMVEGGLKKHVETNIVNTLPTTLVYFNIHITSERFHCFQPNCLIQ